MAEGLEDCPFSLRKAFNTHSITASTGKGREEGRRARLGWLSTGYDIMIGASVIDCIFLQGNDAKPVQGGVLGICGLVGP